MSALEIDFSNFSVKRHDREVALTPLEFRLLSAFVRHPHQVLTRDQLIELAWEDPGHVSPRSGEALRRLPAAQDRRGAPIQTVRGFGYRYLRPVTVAA